MLRYFSLDIKSSGPTDISILGATFGVAENPQQLNHSVLHERSQYYDLIASATVTHDPENTTASLNLMSRGIFKGISLPIAP